MDILVCIKRVPDLAEAELSIAPDGLGLDESELSFGTNEWDDFAVEEAVRLKDQHGGTVTAVTIGDEDAEEVLRRALAMGADEALHVTGEDVTDGDPWATARTLRAAIDGRSFDLILCGAISADGTSGQTGGMLAELLGLPQVALATGIEVQDGKAEVRHEVESGLERVVVVDLPALVTVQTGINEPRYVSIRGIRKVANVEVPVRTAADLGFDPPAVGRAGSRVTLEELFLPPRGERAEILEGDEAVSALAGRLREKGGLA